MHGEKEEEEPERKGVGQFGLKGAGGELSERWIKGLVRILDRAPVRMCRRVANDLARCSLFERKRYVVLRAVHISKIGRRPVVNCPVVDQGSFRVDDEDMWCGLCVVEVTQGASRIQQNGGGYGVSLLKKSVLFGCGEVTLPTRSRRNYGEPDNAPASPFTLQALHVSAVVVLLSIRAAAVRPFQNHELALVFGKLMDLAIGVCCGEVGRRFPHSRRPPDRERDQNESD